MRCRRTLSAALTTVAAALVVAPAAGAHGTVERTGLVSTVAKVANGRGLEASVAGDGRFTLVVPAGADVVVLGYANEPYLRFAHGRVYENASSSTAEPSPHWRELTRGRSHTWHDHRTHWMGGDLPAVVRRDRGRRHHISD